MNISEMHMGFDLECDESDSLATPHFEPEEKDYWLNRATRTFVKTRYSGMNPKLEGVEQSQKRVDDLRTLVEEESLDCTIGSNKPNSYIANLSDLTNTYWFALDEEALIAYVSIIDSTTNVSTGDLIIGGVYKVVSGTIVNNGSSYSEGEYFKATATTFTGTGTLIKCSSYRVGVVEINSNNYTFNVKNPYSEHILHFEDANPLRLFLGDTVELITDGNYQVLRYYLRYLRKPIEVSLSGNVDSDLPEHTHDEIVKLAVKMALENTEQPRYSTYSNEVATME